MNSFLIVFLSCIAIVIIILILVAISPDKSREANDEQFINEDGDHIYYDRKLIRHKKSQKNNERLS